MDEIEITDSVSPGDKIEGPLLRPDKVKTFVLSDPVSGDLAIAVTILPHEGDPDFPKPIIVLVPLAKVEFFIKLIRTAQALIPTAEGGSA
jgi:hypothetical protein